MRRLAATVIPVLFLLGGAARAHGEQILPTKYLLVKDPPGDPNARKILWQAVDDNTDGDLSLIGDPTVSGASLHLVMFPSLHCSNPPCDEGGGDQCFNLPAADWHRTGPRGFRYTDPTLANSAVRAASIRQASSGRFFIKAIVHGAGINIFLEDEIGFYGLNLALGGGDDYRTGSSGAEPKPNDGEMFRIRNEDGSNSYVTPCVPSP